MLLNKKKILKCFGFILSVVLLYFVLKSLFNNIEAVKIYIKNVNYFYLFLSILLGSLYNIVNAYNWVGIQKYLGGKNSRINYLHVALLTYFFRYIPGGIWNIFGKIAWCVNKGDSKQLSLASVILEHLLQVITAIFFGGVLVSFFLSSEYSFFSFILLIVILLFPFFISFPLNFFLKKNNEESLSLNVCFLYNYFFRYSLSWILAGISLVVFVKSFSDISPINSLKISLSYPLSWAVGFLSPAPNGLGVREMVLQYLLSSTLGAALVTLIVLLARIWSIISEFVSLILFEGYCLLKKIKIFC